MFPTPISQADQNNGSRTMESTRDALAGFINRDSGLILAAYFPLDIADEARAQGTKNYPKPC